MFLHNDPELFSDVLEAASFALQKPISIIEKDYYVTMILKLLAQNSKECVFKGGTSLSKGYKVINRFSEDIDIVTSRKLTQGERIRLKNNIIRNISLELNLPISDWEKAGSKRDYNIYTFQYTPTTTNIMPINEGVKLEVVLSSLAFPTEILMLDSYIYQFLKSSGNEDIITNYNLIPFPMAVQDIRRTFLDKIFAVCNAFVEKKTFRKSRHIYDLYMLLPYISFDNSLKNLVEKIRNPKYKTRKWLSENQEISINNILQHIIDSHIFETDFDEITTYFLDKPISYNEAISVLSKIIKSDIFAEPFDPFYSEKNQKYPKKSIQQFEKNT